MISHFLPSMCLRREAQSIKTEYSHWQRSQRGCASVDLAHDALQESLSVRMCRQWVSAEQ